MILCGCTAEVDRRVSKGGYKNPPLRGKPDGGKRRADCVKKNGLAM